MKQQKILNKAGGFTIPKLMRLAAGMYPGSIVDIKLEGNAVILTPHQTLCRICGSPEDVVEINGVGICRKCARKVLEGGKND